MILFIAIYTNFFFWVNLFFLIGSCVLTWGAWIGSTKLCLFCFHTFKTAKCESSLVVVSNIPRFWAIYMIMLITRPRGRGRLNLLHGYLSLTCFLGPVSSLSPYLTTQLNLTSVRYFTNVRTLVYHSRFRIGYSYCCSHFNMYLYKCHTYIFTNKSFCRAW